LPRGEKEAAVAEALVRQRVEDLAKAVRAKDTDRVMSFYAADIVSFDIVPPLRYVGADDKVEPGKKPSLHIPAPSPTTYAS
jgi:ketosteroid isomerase-like protein